MAYKRNGTKRTTLLTWKWLWYDTNGGEKWHPLHFYKHELGETLIFDEATNIIIKDQKIVGWSIITKEQLVKLNLGTQVEPQDVLVNAILPTAFQLQVKNLLTDYKDVFAWSYKELKGIPK